MRFEALYLFTVSLADNTLTGKSRKLHEGRALAPHISGTHCVAVQQSLWPSRVADADIIFMAAPCNRGPLYFYPVLSIFLSSYGRPPYAIGQAIIFLPCGFYLLSSFFFSSPNLSGRGLDVYRTSTHGVALVRI